jgi:hypothetical protein
LYAFPCSISLAKPAWNNLFSAPEVHRNVNKEKFMLDLVINFYDNIFPVRTAGHHMNHKIMKYFAMVCMINMHHSFI